MSGLVDLDRLEALEKAATGGEWRYSAPHVLSGDTYMADFYDAFESSEADAEFVAAIRNAAPALIAEVRELRAKLESFKSSEDRRLVCRRLGDDCDASPYRCCKDCRAMNGLPHENGRRPQPRPQLWEGDQA